MAQIKIPKHCGPDGQGLPRAVFDVLLTLINTNALSYVEIKNAIELCFSASTALEWNTVYAPELTERITNKI